MNANATSPLSSADKVKGYAAIGPVRLTFTAVSGAVRTADGIAQFYAVVPKLAANGLLTVAGEGSGPYYLRRGKGRSTTERFYVYFSLGGKPVFAAITEEASKAFLGAAVTVERISPVAEPVAAEPVAAEPVAAEPVVEPVVETRASRRASRRATA